MFSKKSIIFLVIVLFLVFIGSILFFAIQNRTNNNKNEASSTYTATNFSVAYPNNWITDKRVIAGGGTSFTARVASPTEYFPRLTVESTPRVPQDIENKIKALSVYNLLQSEVTFNGHKAIKLEGNLQMQFATGNPQQKPVHKVFILVPTESQLYVISYAYFDDNTKTESEAEIQNMLNSLQIN